MFVLVQRVGDSERGRRIFSKKKKKKKVCVSRKDTYTLDENISICMIPSVDSLCSISILYFLLSSYSFILLQHVGSKEGEQKGDSWLDKLPWYKCVSKRMENPREDKHILGLDLEVDHDCKCTKCATGMSGATLLTKQMRSEGCSKTGTFDSKYELVQELLLYGKGSDPVSLDLVDFKGHLLLLHGNLYLGILIALPCGHIPRANIRYRCPRLKHSTARPSLVMVRLKVLSTEFPEVACVPSDHLFDIGYVGNFMKLNTHFQCALAHQNSVNKDGKYRMNPDILKDIINPQRAASKPAIFCSSLAPCRESISSPFNFPKLNSSSSSSHLSTASDKIHTGRQCDISSAQSKAISYSMATKKGGKDVSCGYDRNDIADCNVTTKGPSAGFQTSSTISDCNIIVKCLEEQLSPASSEPTADTQQVKQGCTPEEWELAIEKEKACLFDSDAAYALDASQAAAVNGLNTFYSIIEGPPGTGKSTCIYNIIRYRLPIGPNDVTLIVSMQNKPIDLLVSIFASRWLRNGSTPLKSGILVAGAQTNPKMGGEAKRFTLQGLIESDHEYQKASKALAAHLLLGASKTQNPERYSKRLEHLQKKVRKLDESISAKVVENARIVFSTFSEIHKLLNNNDLLGFHPRITSIIVEEAGTVPEFCRPMMALFPNLQRIIDIGDTRQLQPFTNTDGLQVAFLRRAKLALQAKRMGVSMLTTQYRMHKDITRFVSETFYDGKVRMDTDQLRPNAPEYLPGGQMQLSGLIWIDYCGVGKPSHGLPRNVERLRHCEEQVGYGIQNKEEIRQIVTLVQLLVKRKALLHKTAAILSFYSNQTSLLRSAFLEDEAVNSQFQQYSADVKAAEQGDWQARERLGRADCTVIRVCGGGELRVQTVDSSQGSEADIVILSCVRSNANKTVGFLGHDSYSRLCVACSRAREAFIVVGDPQTLCELKPMRMLWESQVDETKATKSGRMQLLVTHRVDDLPILAGLPPSLSSSMRAVDYYWKSREDDD